MKPVTLFDPSFRRTDLIFSDTDLARLKSAADLRWAKDEPAPPEEVERIRDEVEIIITGSWRHGEVARFPRLRAIMEVGGGFPSPESLDYQACFARGIRVLSCAPAFGPAVAEMALGLALSSARQISWVDRAFRRGEAPWSHTDLATPVGVPFTHYGKPVGFIGFGGLARSLKPLLEPFGCPISVYDPWLTDTYLRRQGVEPVGIDALLRESRFIYVLAVPSAENRAFLDRAKLELIRKDAVLLLMSRAHVVDFDALTDLVIAGKFHAGIDVYPEEPLAADHPIRTAEFAVLTSHQAGLPGIVEIGRVVADDVEALAAGLVPYAMQKAEPEFIRMRARSDRQN